MKRIVFCMGSLALAACASANDGANAGATPIVIHGEGTPHQTTTHTPSAPDDQALHQKSCAEGAMQACHAAALDRYYSPATPENDASLLALFKKACDGGYAPSCNGLGVLYAEGRGVPKDEAAAVKLFRSSCEAEATTGCSHYAQALDSGRGVPKDATLAALVRARADCVFERSLHPDAGACAPLPR